MTAQRGREDGNSSHHAQNVLFSAPGSVLIKTTLMKSLVVHPNTAFA